MHGEPLPQDPHACTYLFILVYTYWIEYRLGVLFARREGLALDPFVSFCHGCYNDTMQAVARTGRFRQLLRDTMAQDGRREHAFSSGVHHPSR